MALPSEYVVEDAVRSIDDVIVYRANHPIHGTVNVYLPDDTLPLEFAATVRKHLYQNGLQMRNVSLLNVPFATKALEVSQNPNEPYIVTKYSKHDLEDFISNGLTIKPRRMFVILSQLLEAIINLAANGCLIERVHPRQVKLPESRTGNISFTVIEGAESQLEVPKIISSTEDDKLSETDAAVKTQDDAQKDRILAPTLKITQQIDETPAQKETAPAPTAPFDIDRPTTVNEDAEPKDTQKQSRVIQRNIYILGNTIYQLLFGRKYLPSDKVAATNIRKLAGRWRKILDRALTQNIEQRYDTYEAMLVDTKKTLNRNKRAVVAAIPFLIVLVAIAGYFGYERYHRYKIMTSEAGQAIESFLDIVNKTNDEVPELKKPEPAPSAPDEKTILKPFDKIEPLDKD